MIVARVGCCLLAVAALFPDASRADDSAIDKIAVERARQSFVNRVSREHGFDRGELQDLLASVEISTEILEAISKPAERVVPWYDYREIFVNSERILAGVRFWRERQAILQATAERYGVEPEILVAIVGIESSFGERMGRYRVLDSLGTLAFAYPPRADFFASELEAFLLFNREQDNAHIEALGSYAGAMGAGQFIPSSYRAYAVDANGDGRRDLWSDWQDILGSIANYFDRHGWRFGEPVAVPATVAAEAAAHRAESRPALNETVASLRRLGYVFDVEAPESTPAAVVGVEKDPGSTDHWIVFQNFRVITRYNNSVKYALAAHLLSRAIRDSFENAVLQSAGEPADASLRSREL